MLSWRRRAGRAWNSNGCIGLKRIGAVNAVNAVNAVGAVGAVNAVGAVLAAQYHLNINPQVESLKANGLLLQPDTTGKTNSVRAGQKLTFEVKWPDCPMGLS